MDIKKLQKGSHEKWDVGRPVCPMCFEPVEEGTYYCPKCGEACNDLTPYLPFVNIRYNYSIFGRMWNKLWYEKTSVGMKVVSLLFIILFTPIMLIGLPFVLWEKLKNCKNKENRREDTNLSTNSFPPDTE